MAVPSNRPPPPSAQIAAHTCGGIDGGQPHAVPAGVRLQLLQGGDAAGIDSVQVEQAEQDPVGGEVFNHDGDAC
ncbi:hypothetical protein [Catellatospora sichuanensis]|uniref:hypothetical protein n=1 Tax=Catellatospora sichuanensis TaxID=1969805 RepID=UPI001182A630|nr:hypothetical protein [Catellatospora sichuanensis]